MERGGRWPGRCESLEGMRTSERRGNRQGLASCERCSSCGGFASQVWIYLRGCRWGPAPAASLTGLGSRARVQRRGRQQTASDARAAHAGVKAASPRSAFLGLAVVAPILPSEEEEVVGCSICIPHGRLAALDPRENTRVFLTSCIRLRLIEIAEHGRGKSLLRVPPSPALCVLFATEASTSSTPLCGYAILLCDERLETDLCRWPVIPASASCG